MYHISLAVNRCVEMMPYNGAMSDPFRNPDAYPLNAPGDFYVLNGCCIACEAPEHEAPDLMAHTADGHCFFKRQPATADETERACWAVVVGCCGAVRYGGRHPAILKRLEQFGRDACDHAAE
jgi:hypothetical protein